MCYESDESYTTARSHFSRSVSEESLRLLIDNGVDEGPSSSKCGRRDDSTRGRRFREKMERPQKTFDLEQYGCQHPEGNFGVEFEKKYSEAKERFKNLIRSKARIMSRNHDKKRFEINHAGKCRIRLRAVLDSSSEHDDVFIDESEYRKDSSSSEEEFSLSEKQLRNLSLRDEKVYPMYHAMEYKMPRNVDGHRVQRGLTEFVVSNKEFERRRWQEHFDAATRRLRAYCAKPLNERGQTSVYWKDAGGIEVPRAESYLPTKWDFLI